MSGRPAVHLLVIVCSPSGTGKTTLCRRLLGCFPDLRFSVSHTTRKMRAGEADGRDYHFVDDAAFDRMVGAGAFVEWARVHGNRYGTSRAEVAAAAAEGKSLLFDVDHQGARQIRAQRPEAVAIFLLPPSLEEMKRRLVERRTETPESLDLRYRNAVEEIRAYPAFDYLVVNDDIDEATETLAAVVRAERARRERCREAAEGLLASASRTSPSPTGT